MVTSLLASRKVNFPADKAQLGLVTWLTLGLSLAYVGIAPLNVLILSTSLVGQACLGSWLIASISRAQTLSMPLLLGPGLMLGGALSYLLFQSAGRGHSGMAAVCAAGVLSLLGFVRSTRSLQYERSSMWIPVQIVSLAALALSTEFVELLPVAVTGFTYAFVTIRYKRIGKWAMRGLLWASLFVCVVAVVVRREFWWLISDDYQHIEIIMRHLSQSNPFDNWGTFNYGTNYHWLSYAWGGLLNELSVNEGHFVTMTRVVPAMYSLSLAASLILISTSVHLKRWGPVDIIPVWLVVTFSPLDWSGTSTAGVYAVLASLLAVLAAFPAALPTTRFTKRRWFAVAVVLGSLLLVLALTKLTATFAVFLLIGWISWRAVRTRITCRKLSIGFDAFGLMAIFVGLFSALWTLSRLTEGEFTFSWNNPGLGQLGQIHPVLIFMGLVASHLWLWCLIVLLLTCHLAETIRPHGRSVALGGVVFLMVGTSLEMFISAAAGNYTYFSGPMYFLASVTLIFAVLTDVPQIPAKERRAHKLLIIAATIALSLWWNPLSGSSTIWELVGRNSPSFIASYTPLANYVTADPRFVASVAIILFVVAGRRLSLPRFQTATLLALVVALGLASFIPEWVHDFRRLRSDQEVESVVGSSESQQVGTWLANNTPKNALVATNHLTAPDGLPSSDFSLAVWSERTFFIIGPRFFRGNEVERRKAVELSTTWANRPDAQLCADLRSQDIDWFVVDLTLTSNRDWSVCASQRYRLGPFVVLEIFPQEL